MINKKQLTERSFTPSQLSGFDGAHSIQLPVDFIHDLSKADSLQAVLDTIAYWISHVFDADRASITLQDIGPVLPCKILKNISSCIRSQAIMRFLWILKFRLGRLLSDESLLSLNWSFAMTSLSQMSWIVKCFQSMAWAPVWMRPWFTMACVLAP